MSADVREVWNEWLRHLADPVPEPAADRMSRLIQMRRMHAEWVAELDDQMRELVDHHPELADRWAEALGIRPGTV